MGRGLETDIVKNPVRPSLLVPESPNNTQVLSHHEENVNSSSTVRESKKTKGRKTSQTNQRNTDPQILGTADTGKPPELKEKDLKFWEKDLKARENQLAHTTKQLASIKAKVIQQELTIKELENSKSILETEVLIPRSQKRQPEVTGIES